MMNYCDKWGKSKGQHLRRIYLHLVIRGGPDHQTTKGKVLCYLRRRAQYTAYLQRKRQKNGIELLEQQRALEENGGGVRLLIPREISSSRPLPRR